MPTIKNKIVGSEKWLNLRLYSRRRPNVRRLISTSLNMLELDLENLQKNTERRIDEGVTKEKERLIMQILLVAEELDLAVEEVRKVADINILEAIEMVKRKLWNILHSEGLCPIESLGKTFDPHLHEACARN